MIPFALLWDNSRFFSLFLLLAFSVLPVLSLWEDHSQSWTGVDGKVFNREWNDFGQFAFFEH